MRRRIPLSPTQSAAFSMGRALLMFDAWNRNCTVALDFERAMLIDFAALHPRSVRTIVPALETVIRAHGLAKHDLSDAFAVRHFGTARERFMSVIADLISRDLVSESSSSDDSRHIHLHLTDSGRNSVAGFSSPLSFGFRAIYSVLCECWRRKNTSDLSIEIRRAIPDESQFAAGLRSPFVPWLIEAG